MGKNLILDIHSEDVNADSQTNRDDWAIVKKKFQQLIGLSQRCMPDMKSSGLASRLSRGLMT